MRIIEKVKSIIRAIKEKESGAAASNKDFQIVMDNDDGILWIGRSVPTVETTFYEMSKGVIVEIDKNEKVRSIALINAENHDLFKRIFNGMDTAMSGGRDLRFYFDFPN